MQICTSLQTDNHTSIPPHKFFTGRMPFLLPNQQHQSTKGNMQEICIVYNHNTTQSFYGSLDFVRTTRVSLYQKVHFAIFWIFCTNNLDGLPPHPD